MINWNTIDTVLLDMDGTLLDLNFDNHFWQEHVPLRYAEKHGLEIEQAKTKLYPIFKEHEGTMQWYCVDYWTDRLGLDIALLKAEVDHLIAIHPHVLEFLDRLKKLDIKSALVTNAHEKSLMLKMDRTLLHNHLDHVICAHSFGMPKEEVRFWGKLKHKLPYNNKHTLLVDDSLPVLRSAHRAGIKNLLAVYHPDTCQARKDVEEFQGINNFLDIMP
jgi:putative hydrolase of the HAD superfamily